MNKTEQADFLIKNIVPPYEYMDKDPFNKYYVYIDGVYPRHEWKKDDMIIHMTNEEFYKMIAIASFNWEQLYKGIVERVENAGIDWSKLPATEKKEIYPNW